MDTTQATGLTRRTALAGIASLAVCGARAQAAWPERSVTLVHGLGTGTSSDVIARVVADSLSRRLNQSVVVDARSGAGGRLAASQIARSTPDGHTLLTISSAFAASAALHKSLPYRPIDDFSPISMLTECPFVLVTSASNPLQTFSDFASRARASGSPMLFGSAGSGSLQHLAGEFLSRTLNITFQHVPYRGRAQAITDMIAGRIDFMVDSPTAEMRAIRAGKVRPLMVTSATRFFALPDVPTAAEAGIPDFAFTAWEGLVGPAGMPPLLTDRIATEVAAALAEPTVADRIRGLGQVAAPTSPSAFKARVLADIEKWIAVVDGANIERI